MNSRTLGFLRFVPVFALCTMFLLQTCAGKQDPAGFDRVFERLSRAKSFNEMKAFYTSGTIAAVEDAASSDATTARGRNSLLPQFNEKTKWELLQSSSDRSRGMARIRYLDHPSQNMVGYTMELKMKMEKGSWRIDLEDEVRTATRGRGKGELSDYIKRIKKSY